MTKRITLRNGSQIYHREAVRPLPHSLNHLKRTLVRKVLWENRDQTLDLIALLETGFVSLCTPSWHWGCIAVGAPGSSNEFDIQVDPRPSEIKEEVDVCHEFMSGHATLRKRLTRLPPVVLLHGHYAIVDTYCVWGWSAWRGPSYNYSYIYHPSDSSCPL